MAFTLNGKALSSLGAVATKLEGWLDGPNLARGITGVPYSVGIMPSNVASGNARQMQVTLYIKCADIAERPAKLTALYDALSGLINVRTMDAPTRVVRCIVGPIAVASTVPSITMTENAAGMYVAFPLLAIDGASFDEEPRIVAVSAGVYADVAVGSLPSVGVLLWGGDGAWPSEEERVLSYRSVTGVEYGRMTFMPPAGQSLGVDDYLEIDFARRYITKVDANNVRTNAFRWRIAGDWFAIEGIDANRRTDPLILSWPSLLVSLGTATFIYRRAWAL